MCITTTSFWPQVSSQRFLDLCFLAFEDTIVENARNEFRAIWSLREFSSMAYCMEFCSEEKFRPTDHLYITSRQIYCFFLLFSDSLHWRVIQLVKSCVLRRQGLATSVASPKFKQRSWSRATWRTGEHLQGISRDDKVPKDDETERKMMELDVRTGFAEARSTVCRTRE